MAKVQHPRVGTSSFWLLLAFLLAIFLSTEICIICVYILENQVRSLAQEDVSGGSIDIYICFDQLNRTLLKRLATHAGMPTRAMESYFRFVDNIGVRYQIGSTIGTAKVHRCSIPQGCPFSMTIVALLMLSWVKLVRSIGAEPRVLADDLLFTASGSRHLKITTQAMQQSTQYFNAMGAQVADNKCFTFSSKESAHTILEEQIWDEQGTKIPNVISFRDLGAHLNFQNNNNAPTVTKRFTKLQIWQANSQEPT